MSSTRPYVNKLRQDLDPYDTTPNALREDIESIKVLLVSDQKNQINIKRQLSEYENILLGKVDGLKNLSKALTEYPGIDPVMRRLRADAKKPDTKKVEASYLTSVTSYLSSTASSGLTYTQSLFGVSINVEFAAKAKIIADDTIEEHTAESTKGSHSLANRKTILALLKLKDVFDEVPTDGSVKKALKNIFIFYNFTTDKEKLDSALKEKAIELNVDIPKKNAHFTTS